MFNISQFLKRHSLIAGLSLMFLFTWPIDLANSGLLPYEVPFVVSIFLGWGFIGASLIMTGITQGRNAIVNLLKRYLIWRVGWRWYAVAFLLFPAIFILSVLINAVLSQSQIDFNSVLAYEIFGPMARLPVLILPYFLFDAIANGEEIGWRGYVLPRLQTRFGALASSLILGLIWWFWHLPKFLGAESASLFGIFLVKILAEAVLYTWLYNNTRGSLLLVTIFHAAGNTAGVFLPIANTVSGSNLNVLVIAIGLEILTAAVVVKYTAAESFTHKPPARNKIMETGV